MDRIKLVELIEGETAKLSPRGRDLWEELGILMELTPEEQTGRYQQADIVDRVADLPRPEQDTLRRLRMLYEGLYEADEAEKHGEYSEGRRDRYVILAAGIKDRSEGRQVDPNMTVEQAIARLQQ